MRIAIFAAALLLAGCATEMSAEECAGADWFGLGERDGLYGESIDRLAEREERCASFGLAADRNDYMAGRMRGLDAYCTPQSGYDAGRAGRPYRGVCTRESEADFLAEYEIGLRLHRLTAAVESAVEAYDGAVASIESNRREFRFARERLRREDLSEEERSKLNRDVDRYRRTIDRLERDLPRLQSDLYRAEGALEDYRAFLDRRARRY